MSKGHSDERTKIKELPAAVTAFMNILGYDEGTAIKLYLQEKANAEAKKTAKDEIPESSSRNNSSDASRISDTDLLSQPKKPIRIPPLSLKEVKQLNDLDEIRKSTDYKKSYTQRNTSHIGNPQNPHTARLKPLGDARINHADKGTASSGGKSW